MQLRSDIAVYAPDDKLQLAVEVKNRSAASKEWVRQMHRNLLVHTVIPMTPYFLLALPDYFYLWVNGNPLDIDTPPDYTIDTQAALAPYLRQIPQPLTEVSEASLELLVNSWLEDLVNSDISRASVKPEQQWIIDSGLYDAIKKGSVITEAAL